MRAWSAESKAELWCKTIKIKHSQADCKSFRLDRFFLKYFNGIAKFSYNFGQLLRPESCSLPDQIRGSTLPKYFWNCVVPLMIFNMYSMPLQWHSHISKFLEDVLMHFRGSLEHKTKEPYHLLGKWVIQQYEKYPSSTVIFMINCYSAR